MALRVGSSMLLRSMRSPKLISSRAMSEMSFTFAAPNGVHYKDAAVKQVDVPSFSGSFGILPNHVPALAVLSPGVVTVIEDSGDANKFFVSSGTVTINDDSRYLCFGLLFAFKGLFISMASFMSIKISNT